MGEKYGHSCFEFIAGKFKNSVSGIAPVFIEIHDNSLDVALFTKHLSHSFRNSLTLFFFRHNNLVEIAWSFIKWLTFSIILMISIKKTKHPISCHGSLCDSSLNLIVFLWWKCLQIKQLLALLLVVILQSTFIAQPPSNYFLGTTFVNYL